jgi:hypothetical protein
MRGLCARIRQQLQLALSDRQIAVMVGVRPTTVGGCAG